MNLSENIITFPTRRATVNSPTEARGTKFTPYDRASYYCDIIGRNVTGTILQIQLDPLSGKQWRVLLLTDCLTIWKDVSEVHAC